MTESERESIFVAARDALLGSVPDAWAIDAYGSFARSEEWPDSDLDLAVLLAPRQSLPDILGLIAKVSACVHREVDLVDLRKAGDVLRAEILATGRISYQANPDAVLSWEASAMSRYARYREEVRDIMGDFHKTGIGYQP